MQACAAMGNRAGVVKEYQRLTRVLKDELGVAPHPDTRALYERITRAG